jgi:hypothetical protein
MMSFHWMCMTQTLPICIGWANERQQQIIEFQNDQIKALLKKLGKKRLLLTDDQRRVLAVKGHALGRKALLELTATCIIRLIDEPQTDKPATHLAA